jgi:beta-xylosidase
MKRSIVFLVLLFFILVACGGPPAQEIAPTSTPQPPLPTGTPIPPPPTKTPFPPTYTPVSPTATTSPYLFSDDFEGVLAEGWQWLGNDPSKWSLTQAAGSVRIILQPSTIGGGEPKNFLVREAPGGNFELATLLRFTPSSNFQFAGLLIYQSQGNAMQFGRAFANCPGSAFCLGNAIYFDIVEAGAGGKPNFATAVQNPSQAYLRLRRIGTTYTGYYSEDGTAWTEIGKHESSIISPLFVGLIGSQAYQAETTADFDYFKIEALP